MERFAARRDRLWQIAHTEGLEALLVSHPLNVTYLTNFGGDSSHLILTKTKTIIVSDGRFTEQLAEECPGIETVIRPTNQLLHEATAATLNQLVASPIGFESNHLTVAEFDSLRGLTTTAEWKPGSGRVEALRKIKDDDELRQIREAIRFAEKAFTMFRAMLRPESSEKELADQLEMYIRQAGGKGSAFAPIVAVGPRGALPHALPSAKRVAESPLLLVDWGASGPFYKSDLTRILWSNNNGTFSPGSTVDWRRVHAVVREAQRRAIAAIAPGVKTTAVDAAARSYIAEQGFGDYFNHGLGHGFGLQIHEAPFFRPNVETTLEAGMVVTVEPGIYLPGEGGIRIEDDVLITPDGRQLLTSVPREWDESLVEF
jgi:Xaa-Pro aminopeptidase